MSLTSSPQKTRGFSLLEILVAFAVLSLAIGVLLRIFAGGGHIAKTAEDYYRAVITADSLLERVGIESAVQPGIVTGETADGYRWTMTITPYPLNPQMTGGMEGAPTQTNGLRFLPYWIQLDIEWGPIEDPRAFGLETLRISQNQSQSGLN